MSESNAPPPVQSPPDVAQTPAERPPRGGAGRVVLIALVVVAIVGAYYAGRGTLPFAGTHATAQKANKYHCPMHPTVVSDKKGSCPICGMDLVLITGAEPETDGAAKSAQPVQYHCPMHPTVVSDKKGSCPICGMDLVPIDNAKQETMSTPTPAKKKTMYRSTMNENEISDKPGKDSMGMEMVAYEVTEPGESTPAGLAAVSITSETRQRMGLKLGTVEKRALTREVRTSALIGPDETRLFNVTTKIEGWVEVLFVNVTGQSVAKGDPLLTIYSPNLVSAQQEYLIALQATEKLAADKATAVARCGTDLLAAARRRLQLWDINDDQIQRLEKTREVEKTMTLFAAASGVVLEKKVLAGQKILPGDSLLVIADLSTVWADADIYQSDLPYVQVGMSVSIAIPYWPDKAFKGTVTFITPTLDPATRTVKARLVIENPELLLKPNMYANARLSAPLGEVLAIPESAVMRTGDHTYAFKDGGDGKLIPTEIKIGPRSGDYFQLLDGLAAGDNVVTSANFLVDSESSMKAAISAMSESEKDQH